VLSDSPEAFFLDASFGRFVLFEQVEGDAIEDGGFCASVFCAFFAEGHVKHQGSYFQYLSSQFANGIRNITSYKDISVFTNMLSIYLYIDV